MQILEKWAELDEKMRGLYGTKVSQMLNSFRTTHYTVNKTYQELFTAINSYEVNTKIWNPEKQEERMLFFREFSRLLHNYLSSTYTLIQQAKELSEEYEKVREFYKIKIAFLHNDNSYNFGRCLRHITQHFELLELVARFSRIGIEIGQPAKQSIILEKKLLDDKKGNDKKGESKLHPPVEREGFIKYLDEHDEIDLKIVLNQYQSLLDNFFEQFNLKTRELYAKDIEEYDEVNNEIQQLQLELRNTN